MIVMINNKTMIEQILHWVIKGRIFQLNSSLWTPVKSWRGWLEYSVTFSRWLFFTFQQTTEWFAKEKHDHNISNLCPLSTICKNVRQSDLPHTHSVTRTLSLLIVIFTPSQVIVKRVLQYWRGLHLHTISARGQCCVSLSLIREASANSGCSRICCLNSNCGFTGVYFFQHQRCCFQECLNQLKY